MPSLVHKLRVAKREIKRLKSQSPSAVSADASILKLTEENLERVDKERKAAVAQVASLRAEITEVVLMAEKLQARLAEKVGELEASEEHAARLEDELAKAEKALADDED